MRKMRMHKHKVLRRHQLDVSHARRIARSQVATCNMQPCTINPLTIIAGFIVLYATSPLAVTH
jgi:hypothetical protein